MKIFSWKLCTFLCALLALTSCEKDDVDEYGTARLKVVNASSASGVQNFYLVNSALVSSGLSYTEASEYISTSSGNRLTASFRDISSNAEYAAGELWMGNGKSYSVYLMGSGSKARVKMYEDELSSPSSGMARVKFIHLSDGLTSDVVIKDASGNTMVTTLSREVQSGYKNYSAGTLSFSVYGLSSHDLIQSFSLPIGAGKNYTIYFSGSSSSDVEAHTVEY